MIGRINNSCKYYHPWDVFNSSIPLQYSHCKKIFK